MKGKCGLLTPASAFGSKLLDRLRENGRVKTFSSPQCGTTRIRTDHDHESGLVTTSRPTNPTLLDALVLRWSVAIDRSMDGLYLVCDSTTTSTRLKSSAKVLIYQIQ
eukprot:1370534-Amorphochlora_amoeboformis.AAC.1